MTLNLITTKLRAPRRPHGVVERLRLHRQLEMGLRGELILVSAPAGSGKSTLLGSWLAQLTRPSVWLSLDKGDDDPERFLSYLIAAVQQVEPGVGTGLQAALQSHSIEAESLISRLINDLAQLGRDLVLVLDDYHLISNPQIHGAVSFLLAHMPLGLCLVISTRSDPPLSLSRLRVRGQLVEIRAGDLRFSVEEATTFLNDRQGLALSARAVASLEGRTEGWIAGLQLAALSLGGREDKESFVVEFAGSHRYLVDYLLDEVLSRQTSEVRTFLQRTSILERFTAPLCEAVSGQPDSRGLLEQLEAANLFVVPLDDERRWYRYHHLFADFLRHRLVETMPQDVAGLHLQASVWLEVEGWTDEAIAHALAGGDIKRAGRLVEGIALDLGMYWNSTRFITLVAGLPLELIAAVPRLSLYYLWPLINTGEVAAVTAFLDVLESSLAASEQPRTVKALILCLRAYQRMWRMEFGAGIALGHNAQDVLEAAGIEPASDEERFLRVATTNLIALCYLHSDIAKADGYHPVALELSKRYGNFGSMSYNMGRLGQVKHRLGRLRAASDVFGEGIEAARRWETDEGRQAVNVAELYVNSARLLYEWNRLDEARVHLERARAHIELSHYLPVLAAYYRTAADLYLARGEPTAALLVQNKLDRLAREVDPDNVLFQQMTGVLAMGWRLRLLGASPNQEHLRNEVAAWVETTRLRPGDAFSPAYEELYHVLARFLFAQDRTAEALEVLGRLAPAAQADGRRDDLIRYRILQALGNQALGQAGQAVEALSEALELAEPEGYVRSFVDAGPGLRALLGQVPGQYGSYARRLLVAFGPAAIPDLTGSHVQAAPLPGTEPLGQRELSILQLMAGGQTHKEIARVLSLAPNTVRWYMQSLNSKLGASNRVEAINRARERGLL